MIGKSSEAITSAMLSEEASDTKTQAGVFRSAARATVFISWRLGS